MRGYRNANLICLLLGCRAHGGWLYRVKATRPELGFKPALLDLSYGRPAYLSSFESKIRIDRMAKRP
jgi:hypothetical protein